MDVFNSILCWLYRHPEPVATVISALIASILVPILGLFIYHRQKESELVRSRYLDNGLDVISMNAEYSLGVFRHNWARSLTALKLFRDAGGDMPVDLYTSGSYIELEPTSFNLAHSFILKELVEDDIFHQAQQLLYSFVMNSNAFIKYDMCSTIKIAIEGSTEVNLNSSRKTIIEGYFTRLEELDKESRAFYSLLNALHDLASAFSRQKLNFKTVEKFKDQPIVKDRIRQLKEMFAEKLKEIKGT